MISFVQSFVDEIIVFAIRVVAVLFHVSCRVRRFLFGPPPPPLPPEEERLVVITGCDTGFGHGLANKLIETTKCHVVPLCLTSEAVKEFDQLKNDHVISMKCDVTSDSDVAKVKAQVTELCKTKGLKLHGLVNNAGTNVGCGGILFFDTPEKMIQTMNVNFFGALRVTCALQRLLVKGSRIINMSSTSGTVSIPAFISAYSSSKHAVEAWSNDLAMEYSPLGIYVTRVRPGAHATGMVDSGVPTVKANYDAAPDYVRELYGGNFFLEQAKKILTTTNAGPPSDVVDLLVDILESPKPDRAYWVGKDAKWPIKALAGLNEYIQDDIGLTVFRALWMSHSTKKAEESTNKNL